MNTSRVQLAPLDVSDLETASRFSRDLLGFAAAKLRTGCAVFDLADSEPEPGR